MATMDNTTGSEIETDVSPAQPAPAAEVDPCSVSGPSSCPSSASTSVADIDTDSLPPSPASSTSSSSSGKRRTSSESEDGAPKKRKKESSSLAHKNNAAIKHKYWSITNPTYGDSQKSKRGFELGAGTIKELKNDKNEDRHIFFSMKKRSSFEVARYLGIICASELAPIPSKEFNTMFGPKPVYCITIEEDKNAGPSDGIEGPEETENTSDEDEAPEQEYGDTNEILTTETREHDDTSLGEQEASAAPVVTPSNSVVKRIEIIETILNRFPKTVMYFGQFGYKDISFLTRGETTAYDIYKLLNEMTVYKISVRQNEDINVRNITEFTKHTLKPNNVMFVVPEAAICSVGKFYEERGKEFCKGIVLYSNRICLVTLIEYSFLNNFMNEMADYFDTRIHKQLLCKINGSQTQTLIDASNASLDISRVFEAGNIRMEKRGKKPFNYTYKKTRVLRRFSSE